MALSARQRSRSIIQRERGRLVRNTRSDCGNARDIGIARLALDDLSEHDVTDIFRLDTRPLDGFGNDDPARITTSCKTNPFKRSCCSDAALVEAMGSFDGTFPWYGQGARLQVFSSRPTANVCALAKPDA